MMCTTPLVASLSAEVTRDLRLMYTWPSEVFSTSISEPSRVLKRLSRLRSLACTAAPDTTWYSRMASSVLIFFGSSNFSSSSLGILAKASLDGAKTVNGPLPSRAVTSLPALRAVTSVERSLSPTASSTMFLVGAGAGGAGGGEGAFGMSTPSMMCTTPLVASLSAAVTCASRLTYTWPSRTSTNKPEPSRVLNLFSGLRSLACTAAPDTTWYSRMASSSLMFFGSSNSSSSALGILANASLVGANTVNGPLPSKAVTSLPAVRAVTSVERSLTLSASWTMFLVGAAARKWCGISTPSMMCTTPLVASLSAEVTRDLRLMYTWPSEVFSTSISEPSRVLKRLSRLRSLACTAAPDTTWYSRMASSVLMFFGSSNFSSSALGILANASLVGANTVNGPLPSRAVTSLPALRAVTSVERSLSPTASS